MERSGFLLEELRIMFDAGVATRDLSPALDAILLTHGHIDHINALPMLLRLANGCDPAIFVPRLHLNNVREMTRMTWAVKRADADVAG